jgi:hypothetical protein
MFSHKQKKSFIIYSYSDMCRLVTEPSSGLHAGMKQIIINCYSNKNASVY